METTELTRKILGTLDRHLDKISFAVNFLGPAKVREDLGPSHPPENIQQLFSYLALSKGMINELKVMLGAEPWRYGFPGNYIWKLTSPESGYSGPFWSNVMLAIIGALEVLPETWTERVKRWSEAGILGTMLGGLIFCGSPAYEGTSPGGANNPAAQGGQYYTYR